jgi:hypothetical protein
MLTFYSYIDVPVTNLEKRNIEVFTPVNIKVKAKVSLCLIKHITMKVLSEAEVLPGFIASGMVCDEFLAVLTWPSSSWSPSISRADFRELVTALLQCRCDWLGSMEAADQLKWLRE